jgi:Glycosyltransferases involved in cell wall biogenesis
MRPLFSIITVTYNASQFLEQTILSIISQSYRNIEFIVIDGNSTDGTQDIIRKYESHIAYWISEPDNGLYDAMNKGLAKATGDYVWFINAGDEIYSPDTVAQFAAKLPETLPDIIYGETEIIDANGQSLGMRRLHAPEKLNWKSFRMGMLVCHQSFIVHRKIAPAYDLSYRYSSDIDWCIRCMKNAEFLFNSRLSLSKFREGGMTTENRKASLKERYLIMCKYYGKIPTQLRHIWFAFRFYSAKFLKGRV